MDELFGVKQRHVELLPLLDSAYENELHEIFPGLPPSGSVSGIPDTEFLEDFPMDVFNQVIVSETVLKLESFETNSRLPRCIKEGEEQTKKQLEFLQLVFSLLTENIELTTPRAVAEAQPKKKPGNNSSQGEGLMEDEADEDAPSGTTPFRKQMAQRCRGPLSEDVFSIMVPRPTQMNAQATEEAGPFPRWLVHHVPHKPREAGCFSEATSVIVYILDPRINLEYGITGLIRKNKKDKVQVTSLNGMKAGATARHADGTPRALNEWPRYVVSAIREHALWRIVGQAGREPGEDTFRPLASSAVQAQLKALYHENNRAYQLNRLTVYPRVWMNTVMPHLWSETDRRAAEINRSLELDEKGHITDKCYHRLTTQMLAAREFGLPDASEASLIGGGDWIGDIVATNTAKYTYWDEELLRSTWMTIAATMNPMSPDQPETFRAVHRYAAERDEKLRQRHYQRGKDAETLGVELEDDGVPTHFSPFFDMARAPCGGGGPSGKEERTYGTLDPDFTPLSLTLMAWYLDLEFVHGTAVSHYETILMLMGTIVASEPRLGEQFTVLINGPPGAGKSRVEEMLKTLLIADTVRRGGTFSATAQYSTRNPGTTTFYHEANKDLGIINDGATGNGAGLTNVTEGSEVFKQRTSEGSLVRETVNLDKETGLRTVMRLISDLRGTMFICFNGNPEKVHEPIRSRSMLLNMEKIERDGHNQVQQTTISQEKKHRRVTMDKGVSEEPHSRLFQYYATVMGPIVAGGLCIATREDRYSLFTIIYHRFMTILERKFNVKVSETSRQRNRIMQLANAFQRCSEWSIECMGGRPLVAKTENGELISLPVQMSWLEHEIPVVELPGQAQQVRGEAYYTNRAFTTRISEEATVQAISMMQHELVPLSSRKIPAKMIELLKYDHPGTIQFQAIKKPNVIEDGLETYQVNHDVADISDWAKFDNRGRGGDKEDDELNAIASYVLTKDLADSYKITQARVKAFLKELMKTKFKYTPFANAGQQDAPEVEAYVLRCQTVRVPAMNLAGHPHQAGAAPAVASTVKPVWTLNLHWAAAQANMNLSINPVLESIRATLCYHGARERKIALAGFNMLEPQHLSKMVANKKDVRLPYLLHTVHVKGDLETARSLVAPHYDLALLTTYVGQNWKYKPSEASPAQYKGFEHLAEQEEGETHMRTALGLEEWQPGNDRVFRTTAEAELEVRRRLYQIDAQKKQANSTYKTSSYPATYIEQYVRHNNDLLLREREVVYESNEEYAAQARLRAMSRVGKVRVRAGQDESSQVGSQSQSQSQSQRLKRRNLDRFEDMDTDDDGMDEEDMM